MEPGVELVWSRCCDDIEPGDGLVWSLNFYLVGGILFAVPGGFLIGGAEG